MTDVLLAEDDAAIAEPLARALTREGYGCEVVTDGAQALDQALDSRFELLILDLGLPDGSGLEMLAELRTASPDCMLVVTTVMGDDASVVAALSAGAPSTGPVFSSEPPSRGGTDGGIGAPS